MPCPHGANSTPERCSQCIGARPRAVRSDERGVTVDGAMVRGSMLETGLIAQPVAERRAKRSTRHQRAKAAAPPDGSDSSPSFKVEESEFPVEPSDETKVAVETAPDPATGLANCNRPEILQSAPTEPMVQPSAPPRHAR